MSDQPIKMPTLTPYHKVKREYLRLISTDMLQAKQGCRRCHGRGHVGFNPKRNVHIPCGCVMVNMDMLAEALNKVAVENKDKLKIETNIPSLQESLNSQDGNSQGQIIEQPSGEVLPMLGQETGKDSQGLQGVTD